VCPIYWSCGYPDIIECTYTWTRIYVKLDSDCYPFVYDYTDCVTSKVTID